MSATLAVRRLVPRSSESPASGSSRIAGPAGFSVAELGRSFVDKPMAQKSSPDHYLTVRSVSSPSTRRQAGARALPQGRPRMAAPEVQALVQEDPRTRQDDTDWRALAEESMRWIETKPKQEQIAALAEMKEWVKSSGLNWDLWWQYCQHFRSTHGVMDVPKSPRSKEKLYTRGRPKISEAQVHAQAQLPSPQGEMRPHTDEEWHRLAMEAVLWMQETSQEERKAAMGQMKQWVVAAGLNWDAWWTYCKKLQLARKRGENLSPLQRLGHEESFPQPAGWQSAPLRQESSPDASPSAGGQSPQTMDSSQPSLGRDKSSGTVFAEERRAAFAGDPEALAKFDEEEKVRKKKQKEMKQARHEAAILAAQEWEQKTVGFQKECQSHWKDATRAYHKTVFGLD